VFDGHVSGRQRVTRRRRTRASPNTVLAEREAAAFSTGGVRGAAARGASFAAFATIASQILTLGSYIVMARLAAPAVFGQFAAASVLLSFGQMFSDSGMPSALLQRRDRLDAAAVTALVATVTGGALLSLLSLASAPIVGAFFHDAQVTAVTAAMSGTLLINGFIGVPGVLLQRRLSVRRWIGDPVAAAVFGAASGTGLALGLHVWALVIGYYASMITRALWLWISVRWLPDPRLFSLAMWKELARFGRHIIASEVIREIQNAGTTAITGRFLGVSDLGRFRFGWRLVTSATTPILAANAATVQPVLLRAGDDEVRVRSTAITSLRVVSFLALPIAALFIPFGTTISTLVLGSQWRGTGEIMMILSGMALALPLESLAAEIFKVRGRPDLLPKMHSLWTVLSVGFMLALVPAGAKGIALAWSLSTIVVALFAITRLRHVIAVANRDVVRAISPALVSAAVAGVAILVFNSFVLHLHPEADARTIVVAALELIAGAGIYMSGVMLLHREMLRDVRLGLSAIIARRRAEAART
jgi:O-antigen/teichoic acid export membrane protein